MKLIDRYLLRTLFTPLVVCLSAFTLIFVVHDLFDHLEDFVTAGTSLDNALRYYLYLLPSLLVYIVPVSLLLATLYSLSQLTKNNELTAMRASGVSLYRLLIPFAAVGLAASIAVSAINERIGPASAYWCHQFLNREKSRGSEVDVNVVAHVPLKNELHHRLWLVEEFNIATYRMTGVFLTQERADGSRQTEYTAEEAEWLDGAWWFRGVVIQNYDENNNPMGAQREVNLMEMSDLDETPKAFLNEVKYNKEFMSAAELRRFVETRPNLGAESRAIYATDYHSRLAMPWTCLVVTLLGIPLGSETGRRGAFLGVFLSISMFFLLYISINLGLAWGKSGVLAPWLAGWAPVLLFGGLGTVLLYRMR